MSVAALPVRDDAAELPLDPRVHDLGAIGVVSADPTAAATIAIRIAQAQARRRRVVLFDLLGVPTAIEALAPDDDPHGVSDAVRFGLSLGRIARPVAKQPNLFVVPGGAESPLEDDVVRSPLWARWAAEFRDAGALLLVAAVAGDPRVTPLLDSLDGVVFVGEAPPAVPRSRVLGEIEHRALRPARATTVEAPRPSARRRPVAPRVRQEIAPTRSRWPIVAGVVAAGIVAVAVWLGWEYVNRAKAPPAVDERPQITVPSADPLVIPAATDAVDTTGLSAWAVEVANVNSATGALLRVRQAVDSLPVPTYSPVRLGEASSLWYRLIAGAFATPESADSLLAALRARGVLAAGAGRVLRAPWAWMLEEGVPAESAGDKLFLWRQLGLPAYGLQSEQGTVTIFAGAFESDAEAQLLAPLLDSLDIHATLRMRVGSIR